MTKEPIMINDVDVSECEFFSSGLGYCTIGLLADDGTHICECEQNCYYKQLKRLENEYEGFAAKYTDMEIALKNKEEEYDELNKYRPIIDRLLQEFEKYEYIKSISTISYAKQVFEQLDQLKEKNKWYDHYKESALRNKELYNDLSTKYDQLKKDNEELEREIKLKKDFVNSLRKHYERKLEEKKLFLPCCYKNLYEETEEMKNDIAKKYFDLEKENKELKEKVNSYNCSTNCYKYQQAEKYKQALQDIKEIAQGYKPYKVCGDYNNNCEPINEILQKCEVIRVENENEPKR